jgi:hypothetical protein
MCSAEVELINRITLNLILTNKIEGRRIASSGSVQAEVTGFL